MKVIIKDKKSYERAVADLEMYREARAKILNAQSYTIGADQLNRANLKTVENAISDLEVAIYDWETYGKTGRRAGRIVPWDA